MNGYVPKQNLDALKPTQKDLQRLFNTGLASPFYWTDQVVREGTPMIPDLTTAEDKMIRAEKGSSHGAKVFGLALQFTYDDSGWGELQNYHFANHTGARLDGQPIGLLTGQGYAYTSNYIGSPVAGDQLYVGPSGYMETSAGGAASGDKLPIVCEGNSGNVDNGYGNKVYIRIRYDFKLVA